MPPGGLQPQLQRMLSRSPLLNNVAPFLLANLTLLVANGLAVEWAEYLCNKLALVLRAIGMSLFGSTTMVVRSVADWMCMLTGQLVALLGLKEDEMTSPAITAVVESKHPYERCMVQRCKVEFPADVPFMVCECVLCVCPFLQLLTSHRGLLVTDPAIRLPQSHKSRRGYFEAFGTAILGAGPEEKWWVWFAG